MIIAKICDVIRVDKNTIQLRALYKDRRGIIMTEDFILQFRDTEINTENIKSGKEIQIYKKDGRICIII